MLVTVTNSVLLSIIAMSGLAMLDCDQVDEYTPPVDTSEVEVGPATFITVDQWDWTVDDPENRSGKEKTRLRIHYHGNTVEWEGREIPVVLRAKDSILYLVGYDRETERQLRDGKPRYSYFRQDKRQFRAIRPADFPKELATQNMWLSDPKKLDVVLRLDTTSPLFQMSSNAFIWQELLTGDTKGVSVERQVLDEFLEKYKPIRLTAITRTKAPK